MNEDRILSYVICHFFSNETTSIGTSTKNAIQLNGIGILENHAIIKNEKNEIEIKPAQVGAQIKVNGVDLTGPRILKHKDRVLFGCFSKLIQKFNLKNNFFFFKFLPRFIKHVRLY